MRRASRLLGRLFFYLLVVFVVVYSVFPFYWAVISSFKPSDALFSPDPSFLPVPFTLEHYENVFLQANFGRNLLNSLIVAGGATLLSLVLGVLAAYALGRLPFPPKNAVMYIVLSMTMFPQIAVLGGLFLLLRQTGLFNTHLGLILTYVNKDGFIYFDTIGGHDRTIISGRRVIIQTAHGTVKGVTGKRAIHLMEDADRKKVTEIHEIWIDIGARTKKDALARIAIGDVATYDHEFELIHGSVGTARAFDNKVGA